MKKRYLFILILGILLGLFLRDLLGDTPTSAKVVTVRSRNLEHQIETRAETIDEFAWENNLFVDNSGLRSTVYGLRLSHGQTISISTPVQVSINDGGSSQTLTTSAETVGDLLYEQNIALAETDRVSSGFNTFLTDGMTIQIDRIVDLEVEERNEIAYEIIRQNDNSLYYGEEAVTREGRAGEKLEKFLITYKNGVETARKLLASQTVRQPQPKIISFGTKIEIQEYGRGRGSWYAYQDCMCAAHPHYEFGRYVRVINEETGKSIIVRINDRGPNQKIHPDRIIDLDVTAFQRLASPRQGTIPIRVELLRN